MVAQDVNGNVSASSAQGSGVVAADATLPRAGFVAPTPASGSLVSTSTLNVSASAVAAGGDHAVAYGFDAAGFRRARTLDGTTTRYLLGGLLETSASGTISLFDVGGPAGGLGRYTAAPSSAVNPTYMYFSGHGDLAAEADQTGSRTGQYRFDAFGQPRATTTIGGPSLFEGFTGAFDKKLDSASGLVEMGARPYDPALGRLYAVDPVDGGSANAYDYAAQDPVNAYDLLGAFVSFWGDGGDINALDECNIVVIRKPSYCRPPLLPPLLAAHPRDPNHQTARPGPYQSSNIEDARFLFRVGQGLVGCKVGAAAVRLGLLPNLSKMIPVGKVVTASFVVGGCSAGFAISFLNPLPPGAPK